MERRSFIKMASMAGLGTAAVAACQSRPDGAVAKDGSHVTPPDVPDRISGDLSFSRAEYERRYSGVRQGMEADDLDALIVTGTREWHLGELGNLKYLDVPLDWSRTYAIVPIDRDPILFNRIPGFPVFKELPPGGPPPIPPGKPPTVQFEKRKTMPRKDTRFAGDHAPSIVKALQDLRLSKGRIGIVSMRIIPADVMLFLKEHLPEATFVDAEPLLLKMRYYKSSEEQDFLRRSGYIADVGMAAAANAASVGRHDIDVFYAADKACAEAGGPVGGFQLIGSGPWGGKGSNLIIVPGSGRTIENGDMLIPEIASDYKGYFTQLTVPISMGEPSDEFYKAYELCQMVYDFNLTQMRPGKTVWEVDQACHEFTKDVTDGEYGTVFGIQAGEHELTFWHDNYELKPGAMAYNQPFFLPLTKPGGPFHVFGNALLITDNTPESLHQSGLRTVIKAQREMAQ